MKNDQTPSSKSFSASCYADLTVPQILKLLVKRIANAPAPEWMIDFARRRAIRHMNKAAEWLYPAANELDLRYEVNALTEKIRKHNVQGEARSAAELPPPFCSPSSLLFSGLLDLRWKPRISKRYAFGSNPFDFDWLLMLCSKSLLQAYGGHLHHLDECHS